MPKTKDEKYKQPKWENAIAEVVDSDLFSIGQCYEDVAATTLACAKCGSQEFNVGQGNYYTAIRCPKCQWQLCIHQG